MNKRYITWEQVFELLKPIDNNLNVVYGIPKGGMIAAGFLQHARITHDPTEATIILDDLLDSGKTVTYYACQYPNTDVKVLIDKQKEKITDWIVFPWEVEHPQGEDNIQQNIVRQLQYIGEDVIREGLKETPNRIVRSWNELYSGYSQNTKDIMTVFSADGYDQIILLKDIELYSMCEHHMLPFFGKAHVAYIPDEKIVGISKLARLVDIYSRRLQIQERIGDQVTKDLMKYLKPKGAACIIEAVHMCLSGDSLIQLAYLNRLDHPNGVPIKDLVDTPNLSVYCYDPKKKQISIDKIVKVWKVGKKKVYNITYEWFVYNQHKKTRKVGSIKVTNDHLLMLRNRPHNRYNNKNKNRKDGSYISIQNGLSIGDGLMPFTCYEGVPGYTSLLLNNGKGIQEHRFLLEHKLGRKLNRNKVSHHIDECPLNNSFDNLTELTKNDHNKLHNSGKKRPTGKPAWNRKNRNLLICKNCGNEFTTQFSYMEKTRKFCSRNCYLENRYSNHRIINIEYMGVEDVYDMETLTHHNFAVNGVIVHNCMRMRGVSKQGSTMSTSSMVGVFMDKPEARQELMGLIK